MDGLDAILNRGPLRTSRSRLAASPILFIADYIYTLHRSRNASSSIPSSSSTNSIASSIKVVCISDTHNAHTLLELPPGDILIHAGDMTQYGTERQVQACVSWLDRQPHRHKIAIAGNHDTCLARPAVRDNIRWGSVTYLDNASASLSIPGFEREVKVYGNPNTPQYGNWMFQYPRNSGGLMWKGKIPEGVDILVTHGPPKFHLDMDSGLGCDGLLEELYRAKPKMHVFGHIHAGHGVEEGVRFDRVQQAYEQIRRSGLRSSKVALWRRLLELLVLLWYFLLSMIGFSGSETQTTTTTLVNAAIMGGLRDDRLQEPIVVNLQIG